MTTTISPLPTPPTPADSPVDFNTKAFALLGGLPTFVAEANAQAAGLDASVAAAGAQAAIATNKAGEALTSANNAALSKTGADSARDAAVTAKMAAEAALDSFDDRYLGAKAVAPTTDNDGGALLVGALYFRTTAPIGMKVWTGTAWDDAYANLGSKFDKTGGDVDGNINITGTARRITGDFSNASNRPLFQTSVANGNTTIGAIPNGSGSASGFVAYAKSDVTNTELLSVYATATSSVVAATKTGSGNFTHLLFFAGDLERLRIDPTTGNVLATSGALGYGVGAGGTVVQATSKSTAVTLNKPSGRVTLHNSTLAAGASVLFDIVSTFASNSSTVTASLVIGLTANYWDYSVEVVACGSGQLTIRLTNLSASPITQSEVISFNIIAGATT